MRRATITVLCLMLLAPIAAFAREYQTPLAVVEELAAYVAGSDTDFEGANRRYKAAQEALADEAEAIEDAEARPATKRYSEIQAQVAKAMRRDTLPTSAWLMGFFGATLLWGGMAFCIGVARKKGGGKGSA